MLLTFFRYKNYLSRINMSDLTIFWRIVLPSVLPAIGVGMTLGMWVYIRRLDWVRHVGDAPAEDLPRPWGRLGWVALGTVALDEASR